MKTQSNYTYKLMLIFSFFFMSDKTKEELELLKEVLHDLTEDGYYQYKVKNDKEIEIFIALLKKLESLENRG